MMDDELIMRIVKEICQQREKWLEGLTVKHTLAIISIWAKSGEPRKMGQAAAYLNRKGFELREHQDYCELWLKTECLGRFVYPKFGSMTAVPA